MQFTPEEVEVLKHMVQEKLGTPNLSLREKAAMQASKNFFQEYSYLGDDLWSIKPLGWWLAQQSWFKPTYE